MTEHNYGLVLAFDSDDEAFARGVEAGLLYAEVQFMTFTRADRMSRTIHANNAEMVLRISEALNIPVRCEELDDEWLNVIFERKDYHD